jgi:hypothetical protein
LALATPSRSLACRCPSLLARAETERRSAMGGGKASRGARLCAVVCLCVQIGDRREVFEMGKHTGRRMLSWA